MKKQNSEPPANIKRNILLKIGEYQNFFTVIAIVIAAGWGLWLFLSQGEHKPHLIIEQSIEHFDTTNNFYILRVFTKITNVGKRKATIQKGLVTLRQILPLQGCGDIEPCLIDEINRSLVEKVLTNTEFSWPIYAQIALNLKNIVHIGPGEIETLNFEFIVQSYIKTLRIDVNLDNTEHKNNYWKFSSYYEK